MVEVVEMQSGLEKCVSSRDRALLSETWVPILVRKRKKSFVVIAAVGMEGNAALATPFYPQLSPVLSLRKVFWNTLREMRTEAGWVVIWSLMKTKQDVIFQKTRRPHNKSIPITSKELI